MPEIKVELSDLYSALDSAATVMALSSQDWSVAGDFAWLYGIFCGWDDGSVEDGDATSTIAARFRWNAEKVARLRRLRAAVEAFDINVVSDLSGRLLPSGGEVSTHWLVLNVGGFWREGCPDEVAARDLFRRVCDINRGNGSTYEMRRRQVVTTPDGFKAKWPWEVVERSPVVSDNSEEGEDRAD